MSNQLEKVCNFYADFNQASLSQLPELYSQDCLFRDPVQEVEGLQSLTHYFGQMTATLNYCQFEFHSRIEQEDSAFLSWTMHFSHPRLNKGTELLLSGVTELHFADGKIQSHYDYYDLGAMLYEHLPILGGLIKLVKSKVA